MKDLNYFPNEFARGLALKRTGLLGLVVPNVGANICDAITTGIENVSNRQGYSLIVAQSLHDIEREREIIERFIRLRVEGVIALASHHGDGAKAYQTLQDHNIPIVMLIRCPENLAVESVASDDLKGGKLIANHLLDLGHRRIAFVAGSKLASSPHTQRRFRGLTEELKQRQLSLADDRIASNDNLVKTLKDWFNAPYPPTAIVCATDNVAYNTLCALEKLGISVPQSCSLTGFDGSRVGEIMRPCLTTVDILAFEIGRIAGQVFLDQIEAKALGETSRVTKETLVHPKLIVRDSTAPPPS